MLFTDALSALEKHLGSDVSGVTFTLLKEGGRLHTPECFRVSNSPAASRLTFTYSELKSQSESALDCVCLQGSGFAHTGVMDSAADESVFNCVVKAEYIASSSDQSRKDRQFLGLQNDLRFASAAGGGCTPAFARVYKELTEKVDEHVSASQRLARDQWPTLRAKLNRDLVAESADELPEAIISALRGAYPRIDGDLLEETLLSIVDELPEHMNEIPALKAKCRSILEELEWPEHLISDAAEATVNEVQALTSASERLEENFWVVLLWQDPGTEFADSGSAELIGRTFNEPSPYSDLTKLVLPELAALWLDIFYPPHMNSCARLLETDTPEMVDAAIQLWAEASDGPLTEMEEALKTVRELF